ncbi:hypothetical protein P0Y35_10925 [Kiritimatiellaeota bacterium B1221]|nr:hypothetical protein [Kiritimatiellaeota bacterium B1221]
MDIKHHKSGQALVEFCIGLIAILAVVGGMFIIGDMGLARMETRVEATRDASQRSMFAPSSSTQFVRSHIRAVTAGPDNQPYSFDDTSTTGGAVETFLTLVEPSQPAVLQQYAPSHILANMYSSNEMMANTGLVSGQDSQRIDIRDIPIIRKLFVNQDTIHIEETVWSIRTGDLY